MPAGQVWSATAVRPEAGWLDRSVVLATPIAMVKTVNGATNNEAEYCPPSPQSSYLLCRGT